jgi:hypothetical protein
MRAVERSVPVSAAPGGDCHHSAPLLALAHVHHRTPQHVQAAVVLREGGGLEGEVEVLVHLQRTMQGHPVFSLKLSRLEVQAHRNDVIRA